MSEFTFHYFAPEIKPEALVRKRLSDGGKIPLCTTCILKKPHRFPEEQIVVKSDFNSSFIQ